MTSKPDSWYRQSGVIPYRLISGQALEVLLITSRKRKRWVIPKGIVEPGLSAQKSALKEAYEEAGIQGNMSSTAIGTYVYKKWQGVCRVEVFVLEVTEMATDWPEAVLRDRKWMPVEEAVQCVREKQLQRLLLQLPRYVGR